MRKHELLTATLLLDHLANAAMPVLLERLSQQR